MTLYRLIPIDIADTTQYTLLSTYHAVPYLTYHTMPTQHSPHDSDSDIQSVHSNSVPSTPASSTARRRHYSHKPGRNRISTQLAAEVEQAAESEQPSERMKEFLAGVHSGDVAEQPDGLVTPLLPFQREGLAWMQRQEHSAVRGGILADDMYVARHAAYSAR